MSETPISDAAMDTGWSGDALCVSAETCQQLERQLNSARAERDEAKKNEATCHCGEKLSAHRVYSSCTTPIEQTETCPYSIELFEARRELSALQSRLSALEPDPDAPGPAAANASAAQARADSGMYSNLCGQLREELAKEKAGSAAMRTALEDCERQLRFNPPPAARKLAERKAWEDAIQASQAALSTTAGTELLEDLQTLRTALKQYADPGNWHVGSKYDGESSSFTGPEEARKALDETEETEA